MAIDNNADKDKQVQLQWPAPRDWPEARMDVVGQNGNSGEHYEADVPPKADCDEGC